MKTKKSEFNQYFYAEHDGKDWQIGTGDRYILQISGKTKRAKVIRILCSLNEAYISGFNFALYTQANGGPK
jgi:hypothetical protein